MGKTIGELEIELTGAKVTAIRRRDIRTQELAPDMLFEAGDVVVLLGLPEELALAEIRLLQG